MNEEHENKMVSVPFYVYEAQQARTERTVRRLWIVIIILISCIVATNIAWMIYESNYETVLYSQDGSDWNNINIGQQGDINNGAENEVPQKEEPQEFEGD